MKKDRVGLREQLNTNPLAQAAVIGVLAIVVGFLLLTRMSGGGGDEAATDTTAPTEATAPDAAAPEAAAPEATAPDAAAGGGAIPEAAPPGAVSTGGFEAGPGLPEPVVKAYDSGKTPVLLVKRQGGIDDHELNQITKQLRGRENIALFITNPKHVSDYSRIVGGVEIDHVPALIVLSPKSVNKGKEPVASISYGFRGYESVVTAVEDAEYDGKQLPYHPQ